MFGSNADCLTLTQGCMCFALCVCCCRDLLAAVQRDYGQLERCADPRGEVAKNFRVPGFRGTVSFITSMTKTFCSGAGCLAAFGVLRAAWLHSGFSREPGGVVHCVKLPRLWEVGRRKAAIIRARVGLGRATIVSAMDRVA